MRTNITSPSVARRAILSAGLTCGVLDITAALLVYGFLGLPPLHLLQGIAAGILGPRALEGGWTTAFLGLICHFAIAFGAAAVYFVGSRHLPFLTRQAATSGALYGIALRPHRVVVKPLKRSAQIPGWIAQSAVVQDYGDLET